MDRSSTGTNRRADTALRALPGRIGTLPEHERARIAHQVHDELSQLLTGIKSELAACLRRIRQDTPPSDVIHRLQSALVQIDRGLDMAGGVSRDPLDLGIRRQEQRHVRLSNRESQVLRMIGEGQTVSEIAGLLQLSVKTISTYRTRVLDKMQMRTNAELTRYAIKNRLAD